MIEKFLGAAGDFISGSFFVCRYLRYQALAKAGKIVAPRPPKVETLG